MGAKFQSPASPCWRAYQVSETPSPSFVGKALADVGPRQHLRAASPVASTWGFGLENRVKQRRQTLIMTQPASVPCPSERKDPRTSDIAVLGQVQYFHSASDLVIAMFTCLRTISCLQIAALPRQGGAASPAEE